MFQISRTSLTYVAALFTILAINGCSEEDSKLRDGTDTMAARLDSIARHVDPHMNEYANSARVEFLKQIQEPEQFEEKITYQGTVALEMLNAGETEQAIEILTSLQEQLESAEETVQPTYLKSVLDLLALAWLRLGEQQNCIINHSAESCLIPIRDEGIHTLPEGSEKAIEYYEQILREWRQDDMEARWLLNIAYMTLGKHPEEVPEQWLISPDVFDSGYDFKRFTDVAPSVGLADEMALSGGSITDDFNNNGLIDIMTSSWGLSDQLQYYENNGDGTFTKKTEVAGLTGIVGGLNLKHGDFNNNGHVDVFVMRGAWLGEAGHHPNSLLRNNGDGTFSDVTESAGLLSFHPTQTAVWADLNNNGWLDLFIGNESTPADRNPSELYINNKDGTFTNVAEQAGASILGYIKGVTAGDYNNNGYQDLYLSDLDGPNTLLRNEGPDENGIPQFTDVTDQAGVGEPHISFPTWFWDYNNNGYLDLFVSAYHATPADVANEYLGNPHEAELPRLYRNNGDGTFSDVTHEKGLDKVMYTMGSNFGDLDNDGYPDFYVGTGDPNLRSLMPNRMFRNDQGEYFQEVTAPGGFGHLQKGHGVSFADLNNNGNQDIFTNIGGAMEGDVYMNALFHNPGHDNRWITLLFHGEESNRFGVGNRIKVEAETPAGFRTIHERVTTGGSFGASSLQKEIGLGKADEILSLEIYWPASGVRQVFNDVELDRFYRVTENEDQLEPLERTSFQFNSSSNHVH